MVQDIIISILRTIASTPEALEILKTSIIKPALVEVLNDATVKDNESKLLTVAEVANVFGVSKATIHAWSKSSLTKHKVKGSSRTYYKYEDVQNVLTQMKKFKN